MSENVQLALIAALAPVVASMVAAVLMYFKDAEAARLARENSGKLDSVHQLVNSQKDLLVAKVAHLEGQLAAAPKAVANEAR